MRQVQNKVWPIKGSVFIVDERFVNPYMIQTKIMITRTFLFLLALVTGISAANAASGVRAAPSEIGSSAAVSVALINGITRECGEPLHAATCVFCEEPAGLAAAAQLVKRAIFNSAPTCTCTYRSDRARE